MLKDTIVAIATPLQEGAISIIRLSGEESIEIVNRIFSRDLTKSESHKIHYGFIIDPQTKQELDEVLVNVFLSPKTFTTENIVEINCHGGVFITRKILNLCLAQGARLANKGEFTQRAFLNGRIDLTQAEAVHDMIKADRLSSAKLALNTIKGSVRVLLEPLIEDILKIVAQIEVNIDYPEYEDIEQLTHEVIIPMVDTWLIKLKTIIDRAEVGRVISQGVKTAIVGLPNVGKSSLLNALLEEDKAIVTDIEGTTRDLVEGVVRLNHVTLHLIDTAGIRNTEDKIEKMGIDKTNKVIDEAELILFLLDSSKEISAEEKELLSRIENKTHLVVYNKSDLKEKDGISISAQNQSIDPLIQAIEQLYENHVISDNEAVLNNERQISLANMAYMSMNQVSENLRLGLELDLVTIDIQNAYMSLKEILGEVSREDLLDALFSNFCLGK